MPSSDTVRRFGVGCTSVPHWRENRMQFSSYAISWSVVDGDCGFVGLVAVFHDIDGREISRGYYDDHGALVGASSVEGDDDYEPVSPYDAVADAEARSLAARLWPRRRRLPWVVAGLLGVGAGVAVSVTWKCARR